MRISKIARSYRLWFGFCFLCHTASGFAQTESPLLLRESNLGGLKGNGHALTISPDNNHYAYVASIWGSITIDPQRGPGLSTAHKACVVVDGKLDSSYESIRDSTLHFSPDGKRYAYVAMQAGKSIVVVDGEPDPAYENLSRGAVMFSSNGNRVAYEIRGAGGRVVVVDSQPGPVYESLDGGPVFSLDGKHVAYSASKGGRWVLWLTVRKWIHVTTN